MLQLIPIVPLIEVGKVLTYGVQKYEANNWRKGLKWSFWLGAALRHIFKWGLGEDIDPETGYHHLAHAVVSLLFLIEYKTTHPELDDRFKSSTDCFKL